MVSIPDSIFQKYREVADDFINDNFGVNNKILYPPRMINCPICTSSNTLVGARGTNRYSHGGPMPHALRGCVYCGGTGKKEDIAEDAIKLRVYFDVRRFIKIANVVNIPSGSAQVIGFMSDIIKFMKADKFILKSDQENMKTWQFKRYGEPMPHGFKKDRYFVCILERV